jgi:V/A-type H+-transporting ATPase subunit I
MAIVNIKRMSVIALQSEKDKVIKALQELGNVEIVNLKSEVPSQEWGELFNEEVQFSEKRELEGKINEYKFAIDFLDRYAKVKKPLFAEKPSFDEGSLEKMAGKRDVLQAARECRELDGQLISLKSEEMKLNNIIGTLLPWVNLDVPMEEIRNTKQLITFTGTIPFKYRDVLAVFSGAGEKVPECYFESVSEDRETVYLFGMCHPSREEEVMEILRNSEWSRFEMPDFSGTPKEVVEELEKRLEDIKEKRSGIIERAKELAQYRDDLAALYDYHILMKDRVEAYGNAGGTKRSFLLEGWVPATEMDKISTVLQQIGEDIDVAFRDAAEGEDIPTVLDNPKLVQPFEAVTELYSLPGGKDIDPNLLMAPFFFIFFGMMISDAGYGIVLTIISAALLKLMKPAGLAKKLFRLLLLGGVSTVFWGAMFGSWFGDMIKLSPLWMNPLDDPMTLLIFSFVLGIIQIFTGISIQAYKNFRDGQVLDALFDQGLWIMLLAGLIMFAFPNLTDVGKILAAIGAVGLVLTQGRQQKKLIGKVVSGVLSLYSVTGYLSDVLSYSRILALGLATGVIATVVNVIGDLVGVNIIGYVVMTIILIGGHLFNIAINTLGAYVHSSRLQYVEFFSKFYEGGGRAFKPFRINTKHINYCSGAAVGAGEALKPIVDAKTLNSKRREEI